MLCRLFGVAPDQLGLKNTPPVTAERTLPLTDDQSLVAMLDNTAGLLDQLGAAGTALAPHMLHAWKDAVTSRRTMFGLLDPSATDPVGHARAATATVDDLEQLAERYHAVGFQKSVTCAEQQFHAARSYSLIKPPRIARRLIRPLLRSATG